MPGAVLYHDMIMFAHPWPVVLIDCLFVFFLFFNTHTHVRALVRGRGSVRVDLERADLAPARGD
eukprot:COSAG01_NODE_1641_length_9647_cov_5.299539_1_plen_63_part_10